MTKPTVLPIWDTDETNSTEPSAARKLDGWLAPGGVPEKPPFENFNFWQNNVYKWMKEINERGILEWDSSTTYDIPSYVVGSDGTTYASLSASNTGNDPVSSPANWLDVLSAIAISFDDSGVSFTAATVQAALVAIDGIIAALAAADISFDDSGVSITANEVQTAIEQLDAKSLGLLLVAPALNVNNSSVSLPTDDTWVSIGTSASMNVEVGDKIYVYGFAVIGLTINNDTVKYSTRSDKSSGTAVIKSYVDQASTTMTDERMITNPSNIAFEVGNRLAGWYTVTTAGTLVLKFESKWKKYGGGTVSSASVLLTNFGVEVLRP
ncbi:hypothetical protein KAR91_14860 [Candidatus Pacearchaeota archaeon]|nr:hypothetical protein [Candidatus Pacearchaeota archaeon]